jgi:hypothetical protein
VCVRPAIAAGGGGYRGGRGRCEVREDHREAWVNLDDVEDMAAKAGFGETGDAEMRPGFWPT